MRLLLLVRAAVRGGEGKGNPVELGDRWIESD
jgi:hypothetical protein